MNMKNMKSMLLLLLPLLIAGCQSGGGDSTSHPVPAPSFASYRTFAISDSPSAGPASDPAAPGRLAEPVYQAIVASLTGKGYTEADPATADLLVKHHAEFKADGLIGNTERRTMFIEIFDRHTGQQIWMDKRERSSSQTLPPELLQKQITEALAPFPPVSQLPNTKP